MKISYFRHFIASLLFSLTLLTLNGQALRDFDGNEYKAIRLGLQYWISTNLNVTHFRNGDEILEAKTKEEWIKAGLDSIPAYCNFDNDEQKGQTCGKLYNWYAINDPRGLAPEGWHIPTNADWRLLVKNLLGVDEAGPKLKSMTGWRSVNVKNSIGFSAIPAGLRDSRGDFVEFKTKAQWWSNSKPIEPVQSSLIYSVVLNDFTEEVSYRKMDKLCGLSVRILKD